MTKSQQLWSPASVEDEPGHNKGLRGRRNEAALQKRTLNFRRKGWSSYYGPGEAPSDVPALGHPHAPTHRDTHPETDRCASAAPAHHPISGPLMEGRAFRTLCYPNSDSSWDRRTPPPPHRRLLGPSKTRAPRRNLIDLKILDSLLDPKIIAKLLFQKHQPRQWAMHPLH